MPVFLKTASSVLETTSMVAAYELTAVFGALPAGPGMDKSGTNRLPYSLSWRKDWPYPDDETQAGGL